jgi:hypothetical protein
VQRRDHCNPDQRGSARCSPLEENSSALITPAGIDGVPSISLRASELAHEAFRDLA